MNDPTRPHSAMPQVPIVFDDVEVVEETRLGLGCRIEDRVIFAGNLVRLDGTTVTRRGDVGRLVLPRWFVELHRVAPARSDEPVAERRRGDRALALCRATVAATLEDRAHAVRAMPLEEFAVRESRLRDAVLLLPDVG